MIIIIYHNLYDILRPKDSGRNHPTDLYHNSIILFKMGGALQIVRDSRLLIIFLNFDILWAEMSDNLYYHFMHTKSQITITQ